MDLAIKPHEKKAEVCALMQSCTRNLRWIPDRKSSVHRTSMREIHGYSYGKAQRKMGGLDEKGRFIKNRLEEKSD